MSVMADMDVCDEKGSFIESPKEGGGLNSLPVNVAKKPTRVPGVRWPLLEKAREAGSANQKSRFVKISQKVICYLASCIRTSLIPCCKQQHKQ
jgi:hypothetical protein